MCWFEIIKHKCVQKHSHSCIHEVYFGHERLRQLLHSTGFQVSALTWPTFMVPQRKSATELRNTTPTVPHAPKLMRMRLPSGPLFCPPQASNEQQAKRSLK